MENSSDDLPTKGIRDWPEWKYDAGDNSDYEPLPPEASIGTPDVGAESDYEASSGKSLDWEAEYDDEASDYGSPKKLKPDHDETERKSAGSEYEISDGRTPWIAECDHGAAFKHCPIHTANQPINPHSVGNPDPNSRHRDQPAQPMIRASWVGNFTIYSNQGRRCMLEGLNACVSSKAWYSLTRRVVERLPPAIEWEVVPRYCVWPKSFERWGPTDDCIAAFFFPSLTRHEGAYDALVMELIRDDLALKTKVMGSELLVFTSVELPPLLTRFQGKLYLWGVFRGKKPQV